MLAEKVAQERRERDALKSEESVKAPHSVLENRNKSIALMGGSTEIVAILHVNPKLCKPSAQNARQYANLDEHNCADLISSMISEGGQKTPAVVRRTDDEEVPYEIVAGSRRHFAVSWLRANNYPEMDYLVQIEDLRDEQAFRLSDIENRVRTDVSPFERARSYVLAFETFYAKDYQKMGERMGLSKSLLYHYIALGEIDDKVMVAFPKWSDLSVRGSVELVKAWKASEEARDLIIAEAQKIADERKLTPDLPALTLPAAIVKRLVKAGDGAKARGRAPHKPVVVSSSTGAKLFTWIPFKANGSMKITIVNDRALPKDELKAELCKLVDNAFR
jgi:ParB family chromosome partitioning protein